MTVFLIVLPHAQPALAKAIAEAFPEDHYALNEMQWLVSASSTTYEVSAKIKLYDLKNPNAESLGSGVVFATSSYYGKASPQLWEWLKLKSETRQSGQ